MADRITAVVADAEPVAGECELPRLGLHRAFGHHDVVHVEPGSARRGPVLSGTFPDELHSQGVLARLERRLTDEDLFRLDAQEVPAHGPSRVGTLAQRALVPIPLREGLLEDRSSSAAFALGAE